jgi:hypothetical protein
MLLGYGMAKTASLCSYECVYECRCARPREGRIALLAQLCCLACSVPAGQAALSWLALRTSLARGGPYGPKLRRAHTLTALR